MGQNLIEMGERTTTKVSHAQFKKNFCTLKKFLLQSANFQDCQKFIFKEKKHSEIGTYFKDSILKELTNY